MIQVLGQFAPSAFDAGRIASEFQQWLREHHVKPRERQIGVRSPSDCAAANAGTPVLMEWHRDGAGPEPTRVDVKPAVKTMLVWSNIPTELRDENGTEVHPEPFDVIWFDNRRIWHRAPKNSESRWFIGLYDPIVR